MYAITCFLLLLLFIYTVESGRNVVAIRCVPIEECKIFRDELRKKSSLVDTVKCGESDNGGVKVWCAIISDTTTTDNSILLKSTKRNIKQPKEAEPEEKPDPCTNRPRASSKYNGKIGMVPTHPALATVQECQSDSGIRISAGDTTDIDEFPWLAVLQYDTEFEMLCGGVLITRRHVLTAAHCVATKLPPSKVILGDYNLDSEDDCVVYPDGSGEDCAPDPITADIESITVHPGWIEQRRKAFYDDIAIITLKESVNYTSFIKPICLPTYGYKHPKRKYTAAGWGLTETGHTSSVKLKVDLPSVDSDKCSYVYERCVSEDQMCAGGVDGKDSCKGDSGGPLMALDQKRGIFVPVGIVSMGLRDQCGTDGVPGIYTYVPNYLDWIVEQLSDDKI